MLKPGFLGTRITVCVFDDTLWQRAGQCHGCRHDRFIQKEAPNSSRGSGTNGREDGRVGDSYVLAVTSRVLGH